MTRHNIRMLPIQLGVIATFLLIPLWYRLPTAPPFLPSLYVSRFVIVLPILWTIVCWVLTGLPNIRCFASKRRRLAWGIALASLAGWGLLSQTWAFVRATHPEVAQTAGLQFLFVAAFALAAACSETPPRAVIAALIFGLAWNSALIFAQTAQQGAVGLIALGEFPYDMTSSGISIIRAGDLALARPYGLLPHPNILAGVVMVGCLAAVSWIIEPRFWQRWAGSLLFAAGLYALLLTFSRAAWVGLAGGLGIAALLGYRRLLEPRIRRSAIAAAALAVLAILIFFIQYQPFVAARAGEGQESIELRSISDRLVFTDFALRSIGERLLVGVGAGNFPWRASYYLQSTFYDLRGDNVHHVLLSVWAELGTVGLALMLAAITSGSAAAVQVIRAHIDEEGMYRLALFSIFAALFIIGWLDHYPYTILHTQVAWWGSIAVCIGVAAKQKVAKPVNAR